MEDFTSDFQKVLKPSASFSELNSNNMEMLNNFSELNHPLISSHVHGILDYLSSEISSKNNNPNTCNPPYSNQLQFSSSAGPSDTDHQSLFCPFDQTSAHVAQSLPSVEGNLMMPISEIMEILSSPGFGIEDKTNDVAGRKRKRKTEGGDDKPREVIHVRAKRGQATDSHSLAERVRRERINEKLRLLQDLVPGCYKTMGMAVMLDVIINYVRSLQNQIEFLSMKLSAASFFYDFSSPEAEALETLQRTTNPYDVHELGKIVRKEYKGIPSLVHSTWPYMN